MSLAELVVVAALLGLVAVATGSWLMGTGQGANVAAEMQMVQAEAHLLTQYLAQRLRAAGADGSAPAIVYGRPDDIVFHVTGKRLRVVQGRDGQLMEEWPGAPPRRLNRQDVAAEVRFWYQVPGQQEVDRCQNCDAAVRVRFVLTVRSRRYPKVQAQVETAVAVRSRELVGG